MTQETTDTRMRCYRCNRHASPFRKLMLVAGLWICERCNGDAG